MISIHLKTGWWEPPRRRIVAKNRSELETPAYAAITRLPLPCGRRCFHPGAGLLPGAERWAATHNEARLLGQKSIEPRNGRQKTLIAALGPYQWPGCPGRAQPSWKAIQKSGERHEYPPTENTLEWCSQHYRSHQTPCRLHAVIHLRQNNSFVLSFPSLWQKGTKAPQAAGKIHTDFEKGFIMAEVMKFQDFKEEGSESAVKVSSQGAGGWGEVSCDQWSWQSRRSSDWKPLLTFTQGKKLLRRLQQHSWQSQLIRALNTASVLQLCISLSQCVLTGWWWLLLAAQRRRSEVAPLHLTRRPSDL